MPKTKSDYSKTVIYKIVCNDLSITDLYVGSTTNFTKRKYQHKNLCENQKDMTVYNFINDNGGWEGWDMIEIEKYPCKDNNEARARERYWYEQLNAKLNMRKPLFLDKKIENQNYKKMYVKLNYEKHLENQKDYRNNNKSNLKIMKSKSHLKHKESDNKRCANYRENNNDYFINYRLKNKEENNRKKREKYAIIKLFSILPFNEL